MAQDETLIGSLEASLSLNNLNVYDIFNERLPQATQLLSALQVAVSQPYGHVIYLTGIPGTGKTALVRSIHTLIQSRDPNPSLEPSLLPALHAVREVSPTIVSVNAMQLSSGRYLFPAIYKQLNGKNAVKSKALEFLEYNYPSGVSTPPLILIVDEIDALIKNDSETIYQLFDMTTRNRIILITLSNFLDTTTFSTRTASRTRPTLVQFPSYSAAQLATILSRKIGTHAVAPEAVTFASRIGARQGDARAALALVRDAAARARARDGKVIVADVSAVNEDVLTSLYTSILGALSDADRAVVNTLTPLARQAPGRIVEVENLFKAVTASRELHDLLQDDEDVLVSLQTLTEAGVIEASDSPIRPWSQVNFTENVDSIIANREI